MHAHLAPPLTTGRLADRRSIRRQAQRAGVAWASCCLHMRGRLQPGRAPLGNGLRLDTPSTALRALLISGRLRVGVPPKVSAALCELERPARYGRTDACTRARSWTASSTFATRHERSLRPRSSACARLTTSSRTAIFSLLHRRHGPASCEPLREQPQTPATERPLGSGTTWARPAQVSAGDQSGTQPHQAPDPRKDFTS